MENKPKKIGFLFDLDGVIIDSEKEYSKIWAQINQEFPSGTDNLEQVIKGSTLTKILNDHYPDEKIKIAVATRLHELENRMRYNYLPYAKEFLEEIQKLNISSALVTSSDDEKMNHLKEEIPNLLDFFEYVVTGDQVKTSKPSPEGYLLAATKLNCEISDCVVFEDSLQGVMAGKNSGALVVGVCGTLSPEKLSPYSDFLVNNFNELDLNDLFVKLSER